MATTLVTSKFLGLGLGNTIFLANALEFARAAEIEHEP